MEFWHAIFLGGIATFAVPVVIHLIFRLRKRRLVFSSLRFLRESMLRESRRLRLRELLLLLLRCAACILIALAFARPFRPQSALAGSNGRPNEDLVLVVDDSPSLAAQEGVSTRWMSLLKRARDQVAQCAPGDRVALVLASDPARAEIELSGNFGAVTAALTAGQASSGTTSSGTRERPSARRGDLAQALTTGIDLLATSPQSARRVIVCSDFQTNQVDRGAWAEGAQKAAAAGRGIAVQLDTPSGDQPRRLANLAIGEVRPKSDVWIEGRPVAFAIRVANNGETEQPSLRLKLMVDGATVASREVALGPRSSTEVELSALLPRPGEVAGWAEIEARDAFADDDRRFFAVRLRDSLRVLVLEEHLGEKDAFLDEGYYVRMALDPRARGGDQPAGGGGAAANYVQILSSEVSRVTPELFKRADLIVLAGITALKDTELANLEEAVRDGRNLILFAGRSDGRLSDVFYNGLFWKDGAGLLPARPGPLYEGNRLEGKYHQLGEFKSDHPLFKVFAGVNEPSLRLARYTRHWQANPADLKVGARPAGEVLATFGDGTPFVVERMFGKGNVVMFTFPPRPEATDLPKRKAFVPLLHQAVRHLAGVASTSRRCLLAGEQFDFSEAGVAPETPLALEKPAGEKKESGTTKEIVNLTGRDHPVADALGIYAAAFQKGTVRERALWAANLDPRESDLNSEDLASLRNVFTSNSAAAEAGVPALRPWDEEQKAQAPDWRYFLVAAALCLLLEVLLRDFWS
jgi:hypothetical protein